MTGSAGAQAGGVFLYLSDDNVASQLAKLLERERELEGAVTSVSDASAIQGPAVLVVDEKKAEQVLPALRSRGNRPPVIVLFSEMSVESLYKVISTGYLELAGFFRQQDLTSSLVELGKLAATVRDELRRTRGSAAEASYQAVGSLIRRGDVEAEEGHLISLFIDPPMRRFLRDLMSVLERVKKSPLRIVASQLRGRSEDIAALFQAMGMALRSQASSSHRGRGAGRGWMNLGDEFSGLLRDLCTQPPGVNTLPRLHILIEGETGTGKTLVASWIHRYLGQGENGVGLHRLNVAAIPPNLLESELFGALAGAYTDAPVGRPGLLLQAYGEVVFLDEIGDLPLELQAKLLMYLDTYRFRPLGWPIPEDVVAPTYIIAATNQPLKEKVRAGQFRADLYHRFRYKLLLPPLRERKADLPLLVDLVLQDPLVNGGREIEGITHAALQALERHPFPGNFRELEDLLGTACSLAAQDGSKTIEAKHIYEALARM
jgi:hypothetical protein